MIQILSETEGNVIATRVRGKLKKSEYDLILLVLREKENEYEKIPWYFEMQDFQGWDLNAAWRDLKFDVKHAKPT